MRARRNRHRLGGEHGELMLAAMIDILVNLLIFLLTLYGAGPEGLVDGVEVPTAAGHQGTDPKIVAVAVGATGVTVGGRTVVDLSGPIGAARLPAELVHDGSVVPLAEALAPLVPTPTSGSDEPTEIVIQVDRRLPWDVVGPVVATASDAGFQRVRFLIRTED